MISFVTGNNILTLKQLLINKVWYFWFNRGNSNSNKESYHAGELVSTLLCSGAKSIKSQFSSSGASAWCCHGNAAAAEYRVTPPRLNPLERPNVPKTGESKEETGRAVQFQSLFEENCPKLSLNRVYRSIVTSAVKSGFTCIFKAKIFYEIK